MLSLKPSKPAADSSQPHLEAVQRQFSAQQALSREVSEPAVIEAASDDQLMRPRLDESNTAEPRQFPNTPAGPPQNPISKPQPTAGVITVAEDSTDAGIMKQPSSMAKRFGFLSSLRRGSTAAEGSSTLPPQMADPPQDSPRDPPQDPLEQFGGTTPPQPAESGPGVAPESALGSANMSLGVQQGSIPGVKEGSTLGGPLRVQQGSIPGVEGGSTLGSPLAPQRGPDSVQADAEHVTAAPIELPPVFEYGSEGEEAQDAQVMAASSALEHAMLMSCNIALMCDCHMTAQGYGTSGLH